MTELMEALSISTQVVGSMNPNRIHKNLETAAESAVIQDLVDVIVYAQSRQLIEDLRSHQADMEDAIKSAIKSEKTATSKLSETAVKLRESDEELQRLNKARQICFYDARKAIVDKVTLDPKREITHGDVEKARMKLDAVKDALERARTSEQVAVNRLKKACDVLGGLNRSIRHFESLSEPKALTIRSTLALLNGGVHGGS